MKQSIPFIVAAIFAIVAYASIRAYEIIVNPAIQALCLWVLIFATGMGMMFLVSGVFNILNKDNNE